MHRVIAAAAGDSMAGGLLWGISRGADSEDWVRAGLSTAKLSVESQLAVSPLVTSERVRELMADIE
jgi:sugar/nucleoside kinase (ribokinase family)